MDAVRFYEHRDEDRLAAKVYVFACSSNRKTHQVAISRAILSRDSCTRFTQSVRTALDNPISEVPKPNCQNHAIDQFPSEAEVFELVTSGCVCSHSARALRVGSIPAFSHHPASSPER